MVRASSCQVITLDPMNGQNLKKKITSSTIPKKSNRALCQTLISDAGVAYFGKEMIAA